MVEKIDKKIVGWAIKKTDAPAVSTTIEVLERPRVLNGRTYKIKTNDAAVYVTMNDIEIDGKLHPFEIFIKSKNVAHEQWVTAMTRTISAIFRRGGNVTFLAQELKEVFDPAGDGVWDRGRYIPSIVAQVGYAIEEHFQHIGLLDAPIKKEEAPKVENGEYPANATECPSCHVKAYVKIENCGKCLACDYSKCG